MRTLRLLVVATLSCGAFLIAVPSAGASVPSASSACQSFEDLQSDLSDIDPTSAESFDRDALQDVGDAFHEAAKNAPKKVKSALNTLGSVYEAMGGSESAVDALAKNNNGKKFTKALRVFTTYYATNCTGS